MREGYKAFTSELGLAIADNLFALNAATTPDQRKPIIDAISTRVRGKVESAIRNGLTGWQKVRVFLGTLNLDDIVNNDFKSFPLLVSQPFKLTFASGENPPSNQYTIDGQLHAVPLMVDPCQAQVNLVREAQAVVDGIENEIGVLQAQLSGQTEPGDPRLPKAAIIAEIGRISEEELPPAEVALEEARHALGVCRGRQATVGFTEGSVATILAPERI